MLTVDFARLDVAPGMAALDAGCGQGRHTLEFLRLGARVIAMDLAPGDLAYTRYVATALERELSAASAGRGSGGGRGRGGARAGRKGQRQRNGQGGARALALRGDTLHLPFADGAFDRVICSEVLEHVADPARATAELARVLKPGGTIAVSVPTPFTEWAYRFASDEYFNTPGGHVRIFTPRRLATLLAAHGLEVRDIAFAHGFHSFYWWARCVVGLHDEAHPVTRHFQKALTYVMFSPLLTRAERLLDFVWPKSMVAYARRAA